MAVKTYLLSLARCLISRFSFLNLLLSPVIFGPNKSVIPVIGIGLCNLVISSGYFRQLEWVILTLFSAISQVLNCVWGFPAHVGKTFEKKLTFYIAAY